MTETELPIAPPPPRRKLLIGVAGAAAVAGIALVVFILPAEYGIDPTGAGKALGVTQLAEGEGPENIYLKRGMARKNVLFPLQGGPELTRAGVRELFAEQGVTLSADTPLQSDHFEIELLPYEGIELKYVLDQGAPMLFSWRTTAPVNVDMHSHPFEGGTAATESFVIDDMQTQTAVYVAPFTGIHGWYWQNRTLDNVTLTLDATGAFRGSKIFDTAGEHDRPLAPPQPSEDSESAGSKD